MCLAFFTFIPPDTPSQIVKISCPHTKVFAALTEARRHGTTKHICHTNHTPHNQKYILQETQLSQTGRAQHLCKDRNATSSANIYYFYNVLDLEIFKIAQTTFNVAFPRYRQFYWTVPLALIILLKMINNHIKKNFLMPYSLQHHHLTLPRAADLAQYRHLWRMMSTYGATQSWVACQKWRRMC